MTRPVLISLVILGGGCAPSERPSNLPGSSSVELELHASNETDAEIDIELGAVDSSKDLPFGCHISIDLMPFTLKGQQVKGASLSATQIRFLLPCNSKRPGDLEQLDGATFGNDDLAGQHTIEIINHGLAGHPNSLSVSLGRLTLKRTDNWHFHADLTGSIAIDPPDEIPIQVVASLKIWFLHFPPHGFPDEQLINTAKDLVGDPALPSRVIASWGNSLSLGVEEKAKTDQHRIVLRLREQEFMKWEAVANSLYKYKMRQDTPVELADMPSDWREHINDTNLTHCKIEREGFPATWLSIAPHSRSLHFYSSRGGFSPP